jgi:hypothetical protein
VLQLKASNTQAIKARMEAPVGGQFIFSALTAAVEARKRCC